MKYLLAAALVCCGCAHVDGTLEERALSCDSETRECKNLNKLLEKRLNKARQKCPNGYIFYKDWAHEGCIKREEFDRWAGMFRPMRST